MYKAIISLLVLNSCSPAIDLQNIKEDVLKYVNSLDHPHRDMSNTFSKNLVIADDADSTHMMIYMSDVAMISQKKHVSIPGKGDMKLMYTGIPSKVDISSVSMLFDKEVKLFSQQYAYDVISYDSLLRRYRGKYVLYTNSALDKKRSRGTLLSIDPVIVQDIKDNSIFKPHQIFFEDIPDDMAGTPSLFWDIHTEAKSLDIQLEYLTKGISWKCDYNVYIKDDTHLNLRSWITIKNESGAFYRDANISLISGEVKQVVQKVESNEANKTAKADTPSFVVDDEDNSSEKAPKYVLYKIEHMENIKNNETKQISFIESKDIRYSSYLHNEADYTLKDFGEQKLHFSQMLLFENSQKNQLGISLPPGVMRFYKNDALRGKYFMGSSSLPRVNGGKMVDIVLGSSHDIIGTEKVVAHKESNGRVHVVYKITLENYSTEEKTVKVLRAFPGTAKELKIADSCKDICQKKKLSALATRYSLKLKAGETYAFEIHSSAKKEAESKGEQP
jgi:hypothetical protein